MFKSENTHALLVNTEGITRAIHAGPLKEPLARKPQSEIGHPSHGGYEGMVNERLLEICPISMHHIRITHTAFGLDLADLRGKIVSKKTGCIDESYMAMSWDLVSLNCYVSLVRDIFFANKGPFLVTLSRVIGLMTVECAPFGTVKQ